MKDVTWEKAKEDRWIVCFSGINHVTQDGFCGLGDFSAHLTVKCESCGSETFISKEEERRLIQEAHRRRVEEYQL